MVYIYILYHIQIKGYHKPNAHELGAAILHGLHVCCLFMAASEKVPSYDANRRNQQRIYTWPFPIHAEKPKWQFPRRSDPVWEMFVAKDGFRADVSGKDPVLLMGSIDRL